ncbi:hypothetical protein [Halosimplex halobium]|uniref:hypothetical protein n=1 Tax=Halosimplex halobium TaxID=3396618 RepID=UPI003F55C4DD
MSVPLIEAGGASADSREPTQAFSASGGSSSSTAQAATGPSLSFSMADGAEITLTSEDLQLYLAIIQTFLLLYVTIKEVRA